MFLKMRRSKSVMNEDETYEFLKHCREGVLGTIGINGYPHTVPLNYVLFNNKIYFHSAKEGLKLLNIKINSNVSFTVFDNVKIIEEKFTTNYQSVIVYGKAKIIPADKEILIELIKKYSDKFLKEGIAYVEKDFDSTILVEIIIEHITGKRSNK